MNSDEEQFKKGNLQMLILAVLSGQSLHGYAIAREIEQRTLKAFVANEGALYPALRTLERLGLVTSDWQNQESGPSRRVYALTEGGREKLAEQVKAWRKITEAVGGVIDGLPGVLHR